MLSRQIDIYSLHAVVGARTLSIKYLPGNVN